MITNDQFQEAKRTLLDAYGSNSPGVIHVIVKFKLTGAIQKLELGVIMLIQSHNFEESHVKDGYLYSALDQTPMRLEGVTSLYFRMVESEPGSQGYVWPSRCILTEGGTLVIANNYSRDEILSAMTDIVVLDTAEMCERMKGFLK